VTVDLAIDLAGAAFLLTGSCLAVIGGVGLLRLPDFFSRLHGAGITDTAGAGLILFGLMLQAGLSLATLKLITILGFLYLTSPTSTHTLAQSALTHGLKPLLGKRENEPSLR
jgi:multicomponent Na+:H+ antiporter subunit G